MNVACAAEARDVACGKATLRTSPSSGQATINSQLRHPILAACHSRAAFEGSEARARMFDVVLAVLSFSCW
jgi:hypothetical protein